MLTPLQVNLEDETTTSRTIEGLVSRPVPYLLYTNELPTPADSNKSTFVDNSTQLATLSMYR
jgi:hypothetical protein